MLQYSILFFLGVVGLEIKGVDLFVLVPAYISVIFTATCGLLIALHHRRRQKEKFEIIKIFEHELGLDVLISPVLATAHKGLFGCINTTWFIVAIQIAVFTVSVFLLIKYLITV